MGSPYTLNIYIVTSQLYLNKAGETLTTRGEAFTTRFLLKSSTCPTVISALTCLQSLTNAVLLCVPLVLYNGLSLEGRIGLRRE